MFVSQVLTNDHNLWESATPAARQRTIIIFAGWLQVDLSSSHQDFDDKPRFNLFHGDQLIQIAGEDICFPNDTDLSNKKTKQKQDNLFTVASSFAPPKFCSWVVQYKN